MQPRYQFPGLCEPCSRSWRSRWREPQFRGQTRQVGGHVYVVERIGKMDGKSETSSMGKQGLKRIRCSHAITVKETGMFGFSTDQVVTTIVRRSNHYIASCKSSEGTL